MALNRWTLQYIVVFSNFYFEQESFNLLVLVILYFNLTADSSTFKIIHFCALVE